MSPLLIALAAFVGTAALVAAVAMLFTRRSDDRLENRLQVYAGVQTAKSKEELRKQQNLLTKPLENKSSLAEAIVERLPSFKRLMEQADVQIPAAQLVVVSAALAGGGLALGLFLKAPAPLLPLFGGTGGLLPLLWVLWRRKRRLRAFGAQLPDALEMLARSLRSGQSLAAGFNMVSTEIGPPLGKEFGHVFEEQNLGLPLEQSLRDLAHRIPNLDLRFFTMAVVLQRQTGGDLAEVLEKIGSLIRERFQIWGQVQALTGEGRLSGVVLMALPVVIFLAVYQLNPDYVMMLFTDPLGKKMLVGAIIMQILGAFCIRKIVNIKV